MKIVFPDETACIKSLDDIKSLQRFAECTVYETNPKNEEELITRIDDAEVVIINLSKITARIMRKCEKLKFVCFLGIGVWTYVDIEEATRRGIWVTNTPNYAGSSVAEHTIGLLLSIARKITQADAELRRDIWEQKQLEGVELYEKTLGIIGLGSIGKKVAQIGNGLGMKILYYDPIRLSAEEVHRHKVEFREFDDLLQESDFISIHAAPTKENYHMIDLPEFEKMKKTAIFINTARGEIVNTQALCETLRKKEIRGAGLDVFEEEPLPPNHPLKTLTNVVITPHIAYNSEEAIERMLQAAIDNVEAFAKGSPLNVVNEEVLRGS
ncbi:MAG: phosphoglycerate dehydrogenase [Candidatus Aerophobetes bacterium]